MSSKAYRKLVKDKQAKDEVVDQTPAKVSLPQRSTNNVFGQMMMADDSSEEPEVD